MAKRPNPILVFLVVALLVAFSGCVKMEASQKIHRSGASDFNFTVESDYLELMNFTPEAIGKMGFAVENGEVIEGDGKLTVSWKDAYFPPIPTDGDGADNSSTTALFGGASVARRFSFPYFLYSMNFSSKGLGGNSSEAEMAEQLMSGIKLSYRLETFGKIVETNGVKLSDNSVTFDLKKRGEYYVVFRDFFLSSIFGGFSTYRGKCDVNWTCSAWSQSCFDGKISRECRRFGECDRFVFAPVTEASCPSDIRAGRTAPVTTSIYSQEKAPFAQKTESQYEGDFLKLAKEVSLEKMDSFFGVRITRLGFFRHLEFGDWGDEVVDFRADYEITNLGNGTKSFFFDSGAVISGGTQYKYSRSTEFSADDIHPGATVKGYVLYGGVPESLSGPLKIVAGDYYSPDYKRTYVEFDSEYP